MAHYLPAGQTPADVYYTEAAEPTPHGSDSDSNDEIDEDDIDVTTAYSALPEERPGNGESKKFNNTINSSSAQNEHATAIYVANDRIKLEGEHSSSSFTASVDLPASASVPTSRHNSNGSGSIKRHATPMSARQAMKKQYTGGKMSFGPPFSSNTSLLLLTLPLLS